MRQPLLISGIKSWSSWFGFYSRVVTFCFLRTVSTAEGPFSFNHSSMGKPHAHATLLNLMTMLPSVLILTIVLILVGTCDAFTASLPPQISNRCLRPPLEQTKDVARHTIPCLHMQLDKTLVAAAVAAVIIAGTVSMDDTAFAESGALHSAQPVVAGIEIVPAGGGGFGGLGISPFGVGPFGGFGTKKGFLLPWILLASQCNHC